MKTSVSVVIPAFNHARHLSEAVESVLSQDYPLVELLVIDDGSTDDTCVVLTRYGGEVAWYSRPNRGQSATLNEGWSCTRGEVLLYLGDDDLLLPRAISTAVAVLEAYPSCIGVYGGFDLIDEHSRLIRRVWPPRVDLTAMLRDFVAPPAAGTFVRRRAWELAGRWDTSLGQVPDYEFYLRALSLGPLIRIDEPLAAFRVHTGSQTIAPRSALGAAEPAMVVDRYFTRSDLPPQIRRLEKRSRAMAGMAAARYHLRRNDSPAALEHLRRAVGIYPGILLSTRAWRLLANGVRRS